MLKFLLRIGLIYILLTLLSGDSILAIVGAITISELIRLITTQSLFPIKEATTFFLVLQLVFAPFVLYRYLDNQTFYAMHVDEANYFSFVIPSTLAFNILLYVSFKNTTSFIRILKSSKNFKIGVILFIAGFIASYIAPFMPNSLQFVFALIRNFPLIGVFYIFFSNNKYRLHLIIVLTFIYSLSIITGGVFINLFIFAFFVFALFAYEFKFSIKTKTLSIIGAILVAFVIQSFKYEYREQIKGNNSSEVELFVNMSKNSLQNIDELFSKKNLKNFIDRINQGWILSDILYRIPKTVPVVNGEYFIEEIQGVLLPRFLSPNKVSVGDHSKFLYATGRHLNKRTAMNIGFFGDGYLNFGYFGGILFSGFFGLFISFLLNFIHKKSHNYPTLLFWLPLIFFYVMRAGNEFYIISNWMVKSGVLVAIIFYYFRKHLRVDTE